MPEGLALEIDAAGKTGSRLEEGKALRVVVELDDAHVDIARRIAGAAIGQEDAALSIHRQCRPGVRASIEMHLAMRDGNRFGESVTHITGMGDIDLVVRVKCKPKVASGRQHR